MDTGIAGSQLKNFVSYRHSNLTLNYVAEHLVFMNVQFAIYVRNAESAQVYP